MIQEPDGSKHTFSEDVRFSGKHLLTEKAKAVLKKREETASPLLSDVIETKSLLGGEIV